MAKLTLDISGLAGLAPNFAGDLNSTIASPQLRYLGQPGQMANGVWDPLRVQGYMSPVNNVYTALTGTITNSIVSGAYSASADTTYLAENGTNLDTISGLNGTVITATSVLPGSSSFRDLELYQINNSEALFYAYSDYEPSTKSVANLTLGYQTTDLTKGAFQLAAQVYSALSIANTAGEPITTATNYQLAQMFNTGDFITVGTFPVSGIRLYLQMPFVGVNQTWTLKVSIQTDSTSTPSGTDVTGTVVTLNPNSLPAGQYGYVYFTFPTTVQLTARTVYHIVLQPTSFAAITANQGVYWLASYNGNTQYNAGVNTSNGQLEKYDGAAWTVDNTNSMDFALIANQYNYVGSSSGTQVIDNEDAPVRGTNANGFTGGATTLSITQTTTTEINPCIALGIMVSKSTDIVTAVTCDGVNMTLLQKQTASGNNAYWMYLYYITGIANGSHTLTVTISQSESITMLSYAYYDIDQVVPFAISGTYSNTSNHLNGLNVAPTPTTGPPPSMPFLFAHCDNANSATMISQLSLNNVGQIPSFQNASDLYTGIATVASPVTSATGTTYLMAGQADQAVYWFAIYGFLQPVRTSTATVTVPAIVEPATDASVFLHSAQNGFLYWFTNSRVHKFDGGITGGGGGTFTPDVLLFPSYIRCTDAVDDNNLVYIAIESSSLQTPDNRDFPATVIGVYSWDYQSILATIRNYYPAPGARNIKSIFLNNEGAIRLITIGEDGFTEIRGLEYGQFQTLFKLGLKSYPAERDSISYLNNGMVTWLGADGFTYLLGHIMPVAQVAYIQAAEAIYKIGDTTGLQIGTYTPGIMLTGNKNASQSQDGALISYNDSTSGNKVVRWYPHGVGTINSVAQVGNAGNAYTVVAQFPTLAMINYIRIFIAPVGSGGTTTMGTVKTYINQSTVASRTDTITQSDIKKGYKYIKIGQSLTSGVFAVQFEFIWPTNITLSTDGDFMPRFLEVDYAEITKLF